MKCIRDKPYSFFVIGSFELFLEGLQHVGDICFDALFVELRFRYTRNDWNQLARLIERQIETTRGRRDRFEHVFRALVFA